MTHYGPSHNGNGNESNSSKKTLTAADFQGRFGYMKYSSREKAAAAARKLGTSGTHSHAMGSDTIYMPGSKPGAIANKLRKFGLPKPDHGGMSMGMASGAGMSMPMGDELPTGSDGIDGVMSRDLDAQPPDPDSLLDGSLMGMGSAADGTQDEAVSDPLDTRFGDEPGDEVADDAGIDDVMTDQDDIDDFLRGL